MEERPVLDVIVVVIAAIAYIYWMFARCLALFEMLSMN